MHAAQDGVLRGAPPTTAPPPPPPPPTSPGKGTCREGHGTLRPSAAHAASTASSAIFRKVVIFPPATVRNRPPGPSRKTPCFLGTRDSSVSLLRSRGRAPA